MLNRKSCHERDPGDTHVLQGQILGTHIFDRGSWGEEGQKESRRKGQAMRFDDV